MNANTNPDNIYRLNLCRQVLNAADMREYMSKSIELARFTGENFLAILESSKMDENSIELRVEGLIMEVKDALTDLDNDRIKTGIGKLEKAIHGNIRGEKTFENLLQYFPPHPRY